MPIRPEHRWLYPIDWHELSRVIRFERAGGRCEHCHRPHGCDVPHLGEGRWWDRSGIARRSYRVVQAVQRQSELQALADRYRVRCDLHERPDHPRFSARHGSVKMRLRSAHSCWVRRSGTVTSTQFAGDFLRRQGRACAGSKGKNP